MAMLGRVAGAVFALAPLARGGIPADTSVDDALASNDECQDAEGATGACTLEMLQRKGHMQNYVEANSSDDSGTDLRSMGPPSNAMGYKGMKWPDITISGSPAHIFAIGDWGGMDGALHPPNECLPHDKKPGCRPRVIAYHGGQTPGPHVFPRTRWNKQHSHLLCSHKQLVACYNHEGCDPGCGFTPGVDTQPQQLVANAFRARQGKSHPGAVFNVGDNFYWGGIETDCGSNMHHITPTARHQFNSIFEGIYGGNAPWLSVLGNHDWGGRVFNNGWDQQIAYTWASNRWIMPAPYWTVTLKFPAMGFDMDVFMLDSNFVDAKPGGADPEHNICGPHNPAGANCAAAGGPQTVEECPGFFAGLWAEQQPWIRRKMGASKARWQVVVTHFPCGHASGFYQQLHGAGLDLLVTGHRHDQELTRVGALTCIVTGGGGGITSEASPSDKKEWYGEGQYGFYDITVSKDKLFIESINYDGKVLKTATVH